MLDWTAALGSLSSLCRGDGKFGLFTLVARACVLVYLTAFAWVYYETTVRLTGRKCTFFVAIKYCIRDFRLPPRNSYELLCSGLLRSG